jgi:5-methylthioadenosine/S-adenosylhomocysteine deaminase
MLLVRGGVVVAMDEVRRVIHGGAVLIEGDRIRAIGDAGTLGSVPGITRTIVADRHILLPGLINAHNHAFQTLYRGLGRDRSLADWSTRTIFPLSRGLGRAEVRAGALLACLEMLTTGTTTFVDSHYIHCDPETFDGLAEAVVTSGLRAVLGRAAVDGPVVPEPFRETPFDAARRAEEAIARWHGAASGRLRVRPEALSERTATPALIKAMSEVGRRLGTGFNMHLAESQPAVAHVRETAGCSPLELLEGLKATGPDVLIAHAVWLEETDLEILARTGTRVAHNPVSNQYLAVGIAPVARMLAHGAVVGLGTGGAASNNSLDMFGVMKSCGLLQKVSAGDAAILPAERILAMGTVDGARALGLQDEVGSLEPGKKADLIAVRVDRPEMVPLHSVYESLVYSAAAAAVDTVVVDGRVLVDGGRVTSLDVSAVLAEAASVGDRLRRQAGLG